MNQVSYTHPDDAKGPRYVVSAGRSILLRPGETAMVDVPEGVTELDGKAPAKKAKKAGEGSGDGASSLKTLLKEPVSKITELLPAMEEPELTELLQMEKAQPNPRVTLITEIEARLLSLKAQG